MNVKKRWKRISIVGLVILIPMILTPELRGAGNPTQTDGSPGNDDTVIVRVYYPDLDTAHKVFISFEAQMLETNYEAGYHVMEVTQHDIDRLTEAGLRVEIDTEWKVPQPPPPQISGIPGYPCYRTVEETFASVQAIAANYPHLATWTDVGDSWEKMASLGGYDMMVLRLTNSATPGPKPKLFVTAAIHAREYTTAELVTRFAEYLVDNYGTDADATWLLDHHEIHLMVHTNPDGRKQAETGLYWRKNTNRNYCGPTSNYRGADLNRNFSFRWGCCGGSSSYPCSETYRGPSPASEPETQAVQDYVLAQFPDQRGPDQGDPAPDDATGVYIDVHSYSELVLWPWGFTSAPTGNGTQLQTLGRKFAYWNDYTPEQAIGLYPTDGTTDDFVYGELGVAAYTFELGTAFFQDCSAFENTILPDNLPALIYAAKVARTPYMTPAGPDATHLSLSANSAPTGVLAGTLITLTSTIDDTRYNHSNGVEPTQHIAAAEYYVDVPVWVIDPPPAPVAMTPSDGSFDSSVENVAATIDTSGLSEGQHIVYVRGQDANGNWGAFSAIFLNVTAPRTCWARLNDDPTDYPTVQAAVDAANGCDVVKVAGHCAGVEARAGVTQTVYLSKSLTVQGGYTTTNWITPDPATNQTTLDAQGQGRVLHIADGINVTIDGLCITGGNATEGGGVMVGFFDAVTLTRNIIVDNTAGLGGGISVNALAFPVPIVLSDNYIIDNSANYGGGLYLSNSTATLRGNTITGNTAKAGGGVYLTSSDAVLSGNIVSGNIASGTVSADFDPIGGGGLALVETGDVTLEGNTIISNTAGNYGGGLYVVYRSNVTLVNNVVADNQANHGGNGLCVGGAWANLRHNTIVYNEGSAGSGVYVDKYSPMWPETHYSTVWLTNTIIASHPVGVEATAGNTVKLTATLWHGNTTDRSGSGIITHTCDYTGTPAFVNPAHGDYHIAPGSAAIDKGVNAGVTVDIDGEPRPAGDGYDIGADEVQPANTPPTLSGLPDQVFDHSTSPPGTIDLWAYASDLETPVGELTYTVEGPPPAGAGVWLEGNRYVHVDPSPNWCGGCDVTVRVADPGGLWDEDTFRVAVSWSCPGPVEMPGAPVLIAPVDGRTTHSDAPTFAWHPVGGAQAYQILVDDVDEGHPADFSRPELDETLAGTEYVLAAGLGAGTYTWRVRAVNGAEVGDWSAGWAFTVRAPSPTKFEVCLPVVAREYP